MRFTTVIVSVVDATGASVFIVVGEQNSFKQMLREAVIGSEIRFVGMFNFSRSYKKRTLLLG